MVEVERTKMTSKSSVAVKQEKRDDQEEIDQLAAKMVEVNRMKLASLAAIPTASTGTVQQASSSRVAVPAPGTLLNYFARNSAGVGPSSEPVKEAPATKPGGDSASAAAPPIDQESAKGRFGWTDSPVHLPYVYRGPEEKKHCAVRILEQRAVKSYGSMLRSELAGCISIRSSYVTEVEARLLNEINVKHCDWQFGRELFTVRDLVVELSDALELLQFLQTCHEKLTRRSCNPEDRCGFFRIGGESVVPYTVVRGVKYVPLFYFEGETGNLDKRAIQITGWDLAYLKLCCKVQGIRNELFSNDSYSAVSVDDIKQQFPAQTELQLFWPSRSLLDSSSGSSSSSSGPSIAMWIKKPSGSPPPLPSSAATSSVIQRNPASSSSAATARSHHHHHSQPPLPPLPSARQSQQPPPPPPPAPAGPAACSPFSQMYNGWSTMPSYHTQQVQSQRESGGGSITAGTSTSSATAAAAAHFASILQQQQQSSRAASSREQQQTAAAISAMLSGTAGASAALGHSHSMGQQSLNMMHYAQAVLSMHQQQQRSHHQTGTAGQHPSHPPPVVVVPPPPPPSHSQGTGNAVLDNLLRANGLDHHLRPSSHGGSSTHAGQHRTSSTSSASSYSTSQSPLTGVVPGSSPHSRSSTGASPRPGLPVPTSGLSVHSGASSLLSSSATTSSSAAAAGSSSSASKPPPPPLIPVNGSRQSLYASATHSTTSSSTRLADPSPSSGRGSDSSRAYQPHLLQHHTSHFPPPLPPPSASTSVPIPAAPSPSPYASRQPSSSSSSLSSPQLPQQQSLGPDPPFKLTLYTIENQAIPCVNSRMYVYNNLMMSLPDMAAYLFPHLGHQTCKQVLQDGLGVTLYEANPQQLQVLKSSGKVSSVGAMLATAGPNDVAKVSLVNVRDVVQYMPQIRYMMSRLTEAAVATGENNAAAADLSHAHSATKRQRVS